jgi:hypothetical protein
MKPFIIIFSLAIAVGLAGAGFYAYQHTGGGQVVVRPPSGQEDPSSTPPAAGNPTSSIASFAECAAAGYPIMESFPRQCRVPGGESFTEPRATTTPDVSDLIHVAAPAENTLVTSPLAVTGEARGTWYFEASFPIVLLDATGKTIVEDHATAQGDWMTEDFVPFTASLTFAKPATANGTLVLKRDNPSGLPQNDAEIRIPVRFSANTAVKAGACRRTGCSGEICSDQDVASSCIYQEQYACYKNAKCERQENGNCDWTMTPALQACLQENIQLE